MCFLASLIPATFWLVVGYFVLFSAVRTDGGIRRFGQVLAIWVFVVAAVLPLVGAYVTLMGFCPIGALLGSMHGQT